MMKVMRLLWYERRNGGEKNGLSENPMNEAEDEGEEGYVS